MMESVNTFDILWEGKLEPNSPSQISQTSYIEDMIFEDNFANDLLINQLNNFDSKKSVEEILWELDNGKPFGIEDDIPSTNDNKINVPIFDFMSTVDNGNYIPQQSSFTTQIDDKAKTEELLMEFDNIFDAVELNHLTPPQTPPGPQYNITSNHQIVTEQQEKHLDQVFYTILNDNQYVQTQQQQTCQLVYQSQQNYNNNIYNQNVMQTISSNTTAEQEISIIFENTSDNNNSITNSAGVGQNLSNILILKEAQIARELEVVDELVRSQAKKLPDNDDEDYSSGGSSISFSPRSDESSSGFSQDDDEWAAATTTATQTSKKLKIGTSLIGVAKKRTRPYIRGSEDKKSRKKEQNKNAATRYRQKKKQEIEVILDEEKILLDQHHKLVDDYKDKKREITYLKGLLKELFKAKGLI